MAGPITFIFLATFIASFLETKDLFSALIERCAARSSRRSDLVPRDKH